MDKECEIVQDLIPLYVDGACSHASTEMVEKHLENCRKCTKLLSDLKTDLFESNLTSAKNQAIKNQVKSIKKRTLVTSTVLLTLYSIPIIICLIVNLATGHGLDWFFIVLTSLMVLASVTLVPIVVPDNRFLWSLGSFTASLIMLLAVCQIFSGGNWFWMTAIPVLFGMSVVFLPIVGASKTVKNLVDGYRGIIIMGIDTVLYLLMFVSFGIFKEALSINAFFILLAWGLFLLIRYVKVNVLTKTGLVLTYFVWVPVILTLILTSLQADIYIDIDLIGLLIFICVQLAGIGCITAGIAMNKKPPV